jgi:ornithine carbamoyltransferase
MKHFLDLSDWSVEELHELLDLAVRLKAEVKNGGNAPVLKGKILGMVFQKPSLRTRVSFEVGMQQLGGMALYMGPDEVGLGKRESTADIARVLSRYVHGIMARVFAHQDVVDLATWGSVPVINGLSDQQHPCQALADIMTIYEHCGRTQGVRVTYVGDGNNVAASLLQGAALFGMHFRIAAPQGYEFSEDTLSRAGDIAEKTGATIETYHDPRAAVQGAEVIYTDTWVSMGQEAETAVRIPIMRPYQVNQALVALAEPDAIVMHCLPAHRGQELTDEVADGPHSVIFDQAENRLHAQKAVLVRLLAEQ